MCCFVSQSNTCKQFNMYRSFINLASRHVASKIKMEIKGKKNMSNLVCGWETPFVAPKIAPDLGNQSIPQTLNRSFPSPLDSNVHGGNSKDSTSPVTLSHAASLEACARSPMLLPVQAWEIKTAAQLGVHSSKGLNLPELGIVGKCWR